MVVNAKFFSIPLVDLMDTPKFAVLSVRPYYSYEKGKKTELVLGYVYTVANTDTYENFDVKVAGAPTITQDLVDTASSRIFVTFENAIVQPFQIKFGKADCTVIASKVSIVKG